jgi:starch synthase
MLKALQRAVHAYSDTSLWRKIMKAGMAKDFSWESSAKKYLQVYRSVTKK